LGHEDFSRTQGVEGSSDRAFGLVFAAAFSLVSVWPFLDGGPPRWWALVIACVFAVVALLRPTLLSVLNRLWSHFGLLLSKTLSPVFLGIVFFGVFVPIGAWLRLAGKDPLKLKPGSRAASYWITRDPPGPPPNSMTNQY
jgi:hypothetical protein